MLQRLTLAIALAFVPAFVFAKDTAPAAAPTATPAANTTSGAASAPQNTIQLVWTVFLGGINLGTVGIKSSFTGDTYSAVSRLKTAGVVNSFYEAVIDASSVGTVAGNTILPQKYDSNYNGEKSDQKVSLAYAANGIELFSNPPYDVNRFPVSEEQKRGTVDPLSGIVYALAGISVTRQKLCGDTVRVFDGRRRYDVDLKYVGKEDVSSSGGYSGATIKCLMQYKQVAGFKPNLSKGNALPTITVWLATFETKDQGPVKSFIVPVKLMCETPFGVAIAHARKITIDGEQKSG
jgi:hypothetical protein